MNLLTKFSVGQYVYGHRSWLRIIEIRLNLGFEGTPLILLWRGKQQRALNKEVERENIELIQKD